MTNDTLYMRFARVIQWSHNGEPPCLTEGIACQLIVNLGDLAPDNYVGTANPFA